MTTLAHKSNYPSDFETRVEPSEKRAKTAQSPGAPVEVGESQPSLLKRPMPAARISTGEHMDLDLPGEPSAASGVKRRSDVEVVDLERLEGEMQQTSHLKPRRLDELLWGSDLAVPVCLDERLTGPNIHGTGISSIVYESGPQSRSEAELVKLGGKSVLLWKPYGGVDDSTMEELDGSLVFEGMKEELVNLERCRTGRVINESELQQLKAQNPALRIIPSRWVCAKKNATRVRSRIVAKDIATGSARKQGFSSPTPSHDAFDRYGHA